MAVESGGGNGDKGPDGGERVDCVQWRAMKTSRLALEEKRRNKTTASKNILFHQNLEIVVFEKKEKIPNNINFTNLNQEIIPETSSFRI